MKELNPTNAFGELLLDLIEGQYDGDIDKGVSALMETTGLEEDEVISIISGDTIVEDESLLRDIVEAFPDADEEDLSIIVEVATAVDKEDRDALIESIEAEEETRAEEEDEEDDDEESGADYGYSFIHNPYAQFSGVPAAVVSRVNQVEQRLANFEAQKALSDELRSLDNTAWSLVEQGILPPAFKTMLIGNFSDDDQRLARFGQIAQENGVDIGTMLFATQYSLGMLQNASPYVEFRDYSASDEEIAMANFSASVDALVEEDLNAIFGN